MRIFFDGFIYAPQAAGGINRYFENLIRRLPLDVDPILTTAQVRQVNYPSHPNLKSYCFRDFRPRRISKALRKRYFSLIEKRLRFDIAHPTHHRLLSGRSFSHYRCPLVITVHDMIDEKFKNPLGSNALRKRQAIMAAQGIICVSENTRKDLIEIMAVPEDRIKVIYHGSDMDESFSHGHESVPRSPYYLYVGSRARYKNFDGLLRAFKKAASVCAELLLCIVGPEFRAEERTLISALGLAGKIAHYGFVEDRHLAKLYRCSQALVYPSFYEGFGIPLLEAMSCGTVVIASHTSSIPEVVGDAGVIFNPYAVDDLADILISHSSNQAERETLVARGRARAALFSWDKTADKTLAVYRSIM